ncbi:GNAT family N-acetyltransferase [Halobacillus sp. HZG1]|uniref:GNAT family N-acetyltransferase n=1 Tax=Halobacillus sp. HZG1 TaxID=3111769 RepID=UPI002DBCFB5C|nr:GNAT family N-acetyltransferase [Halobacillus sp. HZG1]MEC3884781.1 GNAT family N-acetyltransferase [Halobacillus sp. HZG1]
MIVNKWKTKIGSTGEMTLFQKGNVNVRKLKEEDKYLLAKWLSDPTVLEFYEGRDQPFDLAKVNQVFYSSGDFKDKCLVEFGGKGIGYIQFYQLDDKAKNVYGLTNGNVYGIDQFIGEIEHWNKGLGTLLVTSMVQFLIENKKADRVVMDPQTSNMRAIRCYEKCGFKKVKLLPNREFHEGEYKDCWFMEYCKESI